MNKLEVWALFGAGLVHLFLLVLQRRSESSLFLPHAHLYHLSPPQVRTHRTICGDPSLRMLFPELSGANFPFRGAGGMKHGGMIQGSSVCSVQTPIRKVMMAPGSPSLFRFTHCSLGTQQLMGGSPPFGGQNHLLSEVQIQNGFPNRQNPVPHDTAAAVPLAGRPQQVPV